jgi:hypothetical protein
VSQIYDLYSGGIKKKLRNYWAAWLPTTRYELGDIGEFNGTLFEKVGSLTELGIPFKVAQDTSPSPIDFVSESGVSVNIKAAGETNTAFASVPQGSAGVKIEFGSQGAFVVECPETYEQAMAEPMALEKEVISADRAEKWKHAWAVITRIVTAPSATILISNSSSAGLELSAKADLAAGVTDLGKADLGLSIKSQRGDILKSIGAKDVSPFFQVSMLKGSIVRDRAFGPYSADLIGPTPKPPRLELVRDTEIIRPGPREVKRPRPLKKPREKRGR